MTASSRGNVESIFRLSPTQEGILFHALQAPESGVYFQQFTCRVEGPIDAGEFAASWQEALDRHAAMRALFTWEGRENPLQVVLRQVALPFELVEDPQLIAAGPALDAFLAKDRRRGFRLEVPPLMRVTLIRGAAGAHRLVWSFHHLILDGWSMRLFLEEVLASYSARVSGHEPELRSRLGFEHYIAWLGKQDRVAAEAHWRRELAGFESPTDLRLPRGSGVASREPGEATLQLSREVTQRLVATARAERVTLNTVLRGVWARLLSCCSGDADVVFGATVSGRPAELDGVDTTIGMCINTIPVRVDAGTDAPFAEWLREIQRAQLEAAAFETTPLVDVQRCSDVAAATPLFETIVVFENHPVDTRADTALRVLEPRYVERSNYPLALIVVPGEELTMTLVYDPARFERSVIERVGALLTTGLEAVADDPRLPVDRMSLISDPERRRIAELARGGDLEPPFSNVVEWFESTANRDPDAVAVRFGKTATTYEQLRHRAHAIATELVHKGVRAGDRVALVFERSVDMVASVLAALIAGAAYVPLGPRWPVERLDQMLRAAGAKLILTKRAHESSLPPCASQSLFVEDMPAQVDVAIEPSVRGDDLAYVIFTSGSTGEPKGVEITHANLAHSTAARFDFYRGPVGRFLLLSPYYFDSSVAGFYWTLCSGGTLVLPPPGGERDVRALAQLIDREEVTHTLCLPSLYDILLESAQSDELRSLRVVSVAGEACPASLVRRHDEMLGTTLLVNEYGPTEAAVWSTAHRVDASDAESRVPIGRPIAGASNQVVDAALRPVPIGVAGELLIGGAGLARGYVGDPEQTRERFVEVAIDAAPERFYRTGDLVRWRADGALDFCGRIDDQVKLRGHRIEPAEIAMQISALPDVAEAVVVVHDATLVAYVAGEEQALQRLAIRERLSDVLPDYMLPSEIVSLPELPRTPSGKVDRKALPQPSRRSTTGRSAPRNAAEETLAAIWCDVLGVESVPVDANFFELGGDSLSSIRIIARAHQKGLRVDPSRFADHPTIAGMAAAAEDASRDADPQRDEDSGPIPLTPIQRWFFALDLPERHHWNLAKLVALPADVDVVRLEAAVRCVVEAHDALRLRFLEGAGVWRQEVSDEVGVLECFELGAPGDSDRVVAQVQASLDLASGMPFRAALLRFETGATPQLLLVVHHLAVDAVSWGVILDDLHAAYVALARSGDAQLARPAVSFAGWARSLARLSESEQIAAELVHWKQLESVQVAPMPLDEPDGAARNSVESESAVTVALDEAATQSLLHEIASVYRTNVQDALLTALVQTWHAWVGDETMYLDLEGHGRDSGSGVDVSRTVGWLTAVWPVALRLDGRAEPGVAIKSIKEQLRATPDGGVGFGLLQDRLAAAPRPVLFNYLGRSGASDACGFALVPGVVAHCRSRRGQRGYLLEINTIVHEGRLQATWSFSTNVHRRETIERLASDFLDRLRSVIDHCLAPDAGGRTPSDFPLSGLDQAGLDKLSDLLGE